MKTYTFGEDQPFRSNATLEAIVLTRDFMIVLFKCVEDYSRREGPEFDTWIFSNRVMFKLELTRE